MKYVKKYITLILCIIFASSMIQIQAYQQKNTENDESTEFIIITPEAFLPALHRLQNHKINYSISTKIITLNEIETGKYIEPTGRDLAENIKFLISFAYNNWNTRYVLLTGGKEQLPVRYAHINTSTSSLSKSHYILNQLRGLQDNPILPQFSTYISDLYYADLFFENGSFCSWDSNQNLKFSEKNETMQIDEVDIYPDVAIGRFLCSTNEEVETVVDKIITYEETTDFTDWFERVVVCGGDTHSLWRDILIGSIIPKEFNAQIAWEGEEMGDTVVQLLPQYESQKIYATGFFNQNAAPLTKEVMNTHLNNGCGFLLLAGHGYPEAWGTHPPSIFGSLWLPGPPLNPELYHSDDVRMLSNQHKLPLAVISACSCGDFNETPNPFAWEFVQHAQGGAIATYACSTLGTLLPTTICPDTLNGKLAVGVFDAYAQGITRAGDLWKASISEYLDDEKAMQLGDVAQVYWLNQFNLEEWIFFGDPTLEVGGYH